MNTSQHVYELDHFPEVTVIRILVPILNTDEHIAVVNAILYQLAETQTTPLILDLSEAAFVPTQVFGKFATFVKWLREQGRNQQGKNSQVYMKCKLCALFKNQTSAFEAIRNGQEDTLLLCGIRDEVKEVFRIFF